MTLYVVAIPTFYHDPQNPSNWMIGANMDERVQRAVREAERAGQLLVPRPDDEALRFLWAALNNTHDYTTQGREGAQEARRWLALIGKPRDKPLCE